MNYTEEDIRDAFKAGLTKGDHKSYFDAPLNENEYVAKLKQVKNNINSFPSLEDEDRKLQKELYIANYKDYEYIGGESFHKGIEIGIWGLRKELKKQK